MVIWLEPAIGSTFGVRWVKSQIEHVNHVVPPSLFILSSDTLAGKGSPSLESFRKTRDPLYHNAVKTGASSASRYCEGMAEANGIDFNDPAPVLDEEDEETLAAIDEGIRDAQAGRVVPMEEVRKLLPEWITASS